jgi:hypothetical protein
MIEQNIPIMNRGKPTPLTYSSGRGRRYEHGRVDTTLNSGTLQQNERRGGGTPIVPKIVAPRTTPATITNDTISRRASIKNDSYRRNEKPTPRNLERRPKGGIPDRDRSPIREGRHQVERYRESKPADGTGKGYVEHQDRHKSDLDRSRDRRQHGGRTKRR